MKRLARRIGALTAAGLIGAIAALLRRRAQSAAPEPLASPVPEPPAAPVPPDAQAAIDEARDRLRARAEALRQEIDGDR